MIDFIAANIEPIGAGLVALILLAYAIVTRQWLLLRTASLSLMLSAEKLMKTAEGKEKMDQVFAELWSWAPGWVKKFYDKNKLRLKLQEWYDIAKDMLE